MLFSIVHKVVNSFTVVTLIVFTALYKGFGLSSNFNPGNVLVEVL